MRNLAAIGDSGELGRGASRRNVSAAQSPESARDSSRDVHGSSTGSSPTSISRRAGCLFEEVFDRRALPVPAGGPSRLSSTAGNVGLATLYLQTSRPMRGSWRSSREPRRSGCSRRTSATTASRTPSASRRTSPGSPYPHADVPAPPPAARAPFPTAPGGQRRQVEDGPTLEAPGTAAGRLPQLDVEGARRNPATTSREEGTLAQVDEIALEHHPRRTPPTCRAARDPARTLTF